MAIFEGKKSSNDITNNDRMSDDEVVASYVPPRYLFHDSAVSAKGKVVAQRNFFQFSFFLTKSKISFSFFRYGMPVDCGELILVSVEAKK